MSLATQSATRSDLSPDWNCAKASRAHRGPYQAYQHSLTEVAQ
jgi:hypothetical protein